MNSFFRPLKRRRCLFTMHFIELFCEYFLRRFQNVYIFISSLLGLIHVNVNFYCNFQKSELIWDLRREIAGAWSDIPDTALQPLDDQQSIIALVAHGLSQNKFIFNDISHTTCRRERAKKQK